MRKQQLLIIIGAALAVFGLLLLPKAVVKKQETADVVSPSTEGEATTDEVKESSDAEAKPHSEAANPDKDVNVARLKARLNRTSGNEAVKLYDSIAFAYNQITRVDSAAVYLEKSARIKNEATEYARAADLYADAAVLSLKPINTARYHEKARELYSLALKQAPLNQDIKAKMAMTWVDTDNPMKAITMLREVLEQDPNNQTAIYNLGMLSMQSQQYDKAVSRFEKLLKLNPSDVRAQFYLGMAHMELGNKAEAIKQFEAVKLNTVDPEVVATVAGYLNELKK